MPRLSVNKIYEVVGRVALAFAKLEDAVEIVLIAIGIALPDASKVQRVKNTSPFKYKCELVECYATLIVEKYESSNSKAGMVRRIKALKEGCIRSAEERNALIHGVLRDYEVTADFKFIRSNVIVPSRKAATPTVPPRKLNASEIKRLLSEIETIDRYTLRLKRLRYDIRRLTGALSKIQ